MLYRYVLDDAQLGSNKYVDEVTCLSDAIESQTAQYFYSNGRMLIHILVQMFAGPWGHTAFAVFTTVLFLAVVILFTHYTVGKSRRTPFVWFLAVVTYLYLFQEWSCLWYGIAIGMNYLFPMLPALSTLLMLRLICRHERKVSRKLTVLIPLALLGFVTGWSQECFAIPLSGGIFIWALVNFRKTKLPFWVLAVPLWIGTAVLVFAPGNFVRLATHSIFWSVLNGAVLLAGTWLFWLMLAGLVVIRLVSKNKFKEYLSNNSLGLYMIAVSLAFGMVANTHAQSFNGVSFFSAILLFRMTDLLPEPSGYSLRGILLTSVLTFALFTHQIRLITSCRDLMIDNHQFVEDYIASPDGVVRMPQRRIAADCRPFLRDRFWFTSSVSWWLMFTLEQHYGKGQKPIFPIDNQDYEAYSVPDKYVSEHKPLLSDVEVYPGNDYLWFRPENAPRCGDTVRIEHALPPAKGLGKIYRYIVGRPGYTVLETKIAVDSTKLVRGGLVGLKADVDNIIKVDFNKKCQ